MHLVRPAMISLCVCAAMTLGACERTRRTDAGSDGRDRAEAQAERSSSGAAARFQAHVSEELPPLDPFYEWPPKEARLTGAYDRALWSLDPIYAGPPMARARVPFVDAGADAVPVLMKASWLNEVSFGERSFTYEELAFKEILKRGDAEAVFEDLLRHASQAGQLYALSGLYVVNRARFQEAMESYRPPKPWVWYTNGCVTMALQVHDVLVDFERGRPQHLLLPVEDTDEPLAMR